MTAMDDIRGVVLGVHGRVMPNFPCGVGMRRVARILHGGTEAELSGGLVEGEDWGGIVPSPTD